MSAGDRWYVVDKSVGSWALVSLNKVMEHAHRELGTKVRAREAISRAQREGEAEVPGYRYVCKRGPAHLVVGKSTRTNGVRYFHTGTPGLHLVTILREHAREYLSQDEAERIAGQLNKHTDRHGVVFAHEVET
jgi:hypothetical protein